MLLFRLFFKSISFYTRYDEDLNQREMLEEQRVLSIAGSFKPVIYLQCNSIIKNRQ